MLAAALENQRRFSQIKISSLIFCAPLLGVLDSTPNPVVMGFLRVLAWAAPSLPVVATRASDPSIQYKNPERRRECEEDALMYNGKMRLGSASTLLSMVEQNWRAVSELGVPFLLLAAEKDMWSG